MDEEPRYVVTTKSAYDTLAEALKGGIMFWSNDNTLEAQRSTYENNMWLMIGEIEQVFKRLAESGELSDSLAWELKQKIENSPHLKLVRMPKAWQLTPEQKGE